MAQSNRNLINLIMATDIGERLRSALELGTVIAVLMVLSVLAIERFESYVIQSQVTEAFGLTSTVKSDLTLYRAEHGSWPLANEESIRATLTGGSHGTYVDYLQLGEDGALTTIFSEDRSAAGLAGRQLTIRPLTHPTNPSSPVSWVCGAHRYPSGLTPGGIDKTDIDRADLPTACRNY